MTRRVREAGQVLPFVAIIIAVLLGVAALAVDAGYLRYDQRIQQTAADAAAFAGASQLAYDGNTTNVTTAAQADAAKNNFTNDGVNTIVTVNTPSTTGSYAGNAGSVEVLVKASHPAFFSAIFGRSVNWVTTRAVALAHGYAGGPCIYILNGHVIMNSQNIDAPTCGITVNGDAHFNNSTVTMSSIVATGSVIGGTFTLATPQQNSPIPPTDPCLTITSCRNLTNNPPPRCPGAPALTGTQVIPGCYSGINASGPMMFSPGLYVIDGNFSETGMTLTGSGVTIYVTGRLMANGATMDLTAPTSGPYAGMLFYDAATTQPVNVNASSLTLGGMLYFPNAKVNINASSREYFKLVTREMESNTGGLTIPAATSADSALFPPVLAE
ncbi:hypothetical protein EPN44_06665 [bacterium]|nr:MAG: hypothetical protein EPN44_06665 [bacterium]